MFFLPVFVGGFSGRPSTNSTPQVEADWLLFGCRGDPSGVTESPFGKPKKQRLDEPNMRRTEIARGTRVKLDIPSPQSMMSYKPQSWG